MGAVQKFKKLELRAKGVARVTVEDSLLRRALELYEAGRYLDSWQVAAEAGSLQLWQGAEAQVFGARLAMNVGNSRLAALLICRARREHPQCAEAAVHFMYHLERRRGALAVWRHCVESEQLPDLAPNSLADFKAHRAVIAAGCRDFDTAWRLWDEAAAAHERSAWMLVERSSILLSAEQREEALAALDEALTIRPWFRPAVQYRGRVLHMLGRTMEAVEFLTTAMAHLQSCHVAMQLISLKRELDDPAGMAELVARFEELAPFAEDVDRYWLAARRVDIHLLRQEFTRAAEAADLLPDGYCRALAARLRAPEVSHQKRRLPLQFVHQKHNTCAPATLAALAHYWDRPITMEQIVDAICYDGTYDHSERDWALANGFVAREFKVTMEVTRQLIDLGVPFEVCTVEVGSAHAQALTGYDLLKRTIFIQDPSEPHYREVEADEFFARYELNGPRGMLMVPPEKAALVEALELPEAELYDLSHQFNKALALYDSAAAADALANLEAQAPGHRLTLLARLSQANFDGNEVERLHWINRLLELLPGDERLLQWKYQALRSMGRRDERLRLLRDVVKNEKAHPTFLKCLAEELMEDARDWDEAHRLAWRCHARMPADAGMILVLADMLRRTQRGPAEEWLTFFRFAAAAASKVESFSRIWFGHAQSQGRTEEALAWLRQRCRAFGAKSGAPALTLAEALDSLGLAEMVEVLREAVVLNPTDGDLLRNLARVEARTGDQARAMELLERAAQHCAPGPWRRACASLRRTFGDHAGEMAMWRAILQAEPLALDAHRAVAADLAAARGYDAAVQHLEEACQRFPGHYGLAQIHIGCLREVDHKRAAAETERLLALHPADPWARRELALIWNEAGAHAQALEQAQEAVAITPNEAGSHAILGLVLRAHDRAAEAQECFRRAIVLDVNYSPAFSALMELNPQTAARREALAFIRGEMIRQVLNGSGLEAYRQHASAVLTQEELLAELREVHRARPDLWEAWSVLVRQLQNSKQKDEAVLLAQQATLKFALVPGAWHDMAGAWREVEKPEAAVQCARYALKLNPEWAAGWSLLADLLEDTGKNDEAAAVLRAAQARLPFELGLRAKLAALLWRMEAREEAWQIAENTARQNPGESWAWAFLQNWAKILQKQERVLEVGEQLTRERPEEARSWFILARMLPRERITDILAAVDRAVALNPKLVDAYDFRMETLAGLGRLDEAEATLARTPWALKEMPHVLLGRQAWLRYLRGNAPEALRMMRAVLDEHRDYFWGWELYAQWAEERHDSRGWKRAADEMLRLAPRSPDVLCALGDHALRAGERHQALRYFREALQADSGSPHAAHAVLKAHWDRREIDTLRDAASALPDIGAAGLIKRVYLMLASAERGEEDRTRAGLEWLATHPDMMGALLKDILEYFQGRKKKLFDEVMEKVMKADTIGPAFARLWVHQETQQKRWQCWRALARWLPRLGERLDPALALYFDEIGQAAAASPHVLEFIKECGPALRQRGEIWGKTGYALAASQCYRDTIAWLLPDFRRPDAEGWVLWNLASSLRQLFKPDQAVEVCIHAVEKGMRDSAWARQVAVAALGLAWNGDYDKARELMNRESVAEDLQPDGRLMLLMARALCDVMPRAPAEGHFYFKQFLASSKDIVRGQGFSLQTRRDHEAVVQRMKQHTGTRVMPWQKSRFRKKPAGQGFQLPRAAIFVAVMVGIQLVRLIPEPRPPAPYSPPFDRLLQESRQYSLPAQPTLLQQSSLPPQSLLPPQSSSADRRVEEIMKGWAPDGQSNASPLPGLLPSGSPLLQQQPLVMPPLFKPQE